MKNSISSLTIVIPAYNEAQSLPHFLPELHTFCETHNFQLIIVNDASTDETGEILQHFAETFHQAMILTHKMNRGYGGALSTGLRAVQTPFAITIDADGQHRLEDVLLMLRTQQETGADLVIGKRPLNQSSVAQAYRSVGKQIIRLVAKMMMEIPVEDLNSGMKLYTTELAKKYIPLCPESMAFSDVMTLIFIQKKHRIIETLIQTRERIAGQSTISTMTAIDTIFQIINIVMLFNPLHIFLPIGGIAILIGVLWALPFLFTGHGLSVAALMIIILGVQSIMLGFIAEQLAQIRKKDL